MFLPLLHSLTQTNIFSPFHPLDISIRAPTVWIITHEKLIYLFLFFLFFLFFFKFQQRAIPNKALLGYMMSWVFPLTSFLTDCLYISMAVKTQPLYTPLAKRRIRRIMAVTDFHHWSVVYHPWGKSLLTQFGHVNCKMCCQMMLDREQGVD